MKKPTTRIVLASLLSAAGVALTVTAYKKRQNEYDEDINDTENWENQQEAAVAIAKVLEGDWQARMALAWKLIKENRTNEVDKLICLKTLTPKDPKQLEPELDKTDLQNNGNVLGDPYVLAEESHLMEPETYQSNMGVSSQCRGMSSNYCWTKKGITCASSAHND